MYHPRSLVPVHHSGLLPVRSDGGLQRLEPGQEIAQLPQQAARRPAHAALESPRRPPLPIHLEQALHPHAQAVARAPEQRQVVAKVNQASLQAALEPLLASDAILLSDGGRAYPRCARRLGVQHEVVNVGGPAGARELSHPNGEQSAPTVQSVPATVPGAAILKIGRLTRVGWNLGAFACAVGTGCGVSGRLWTRHPRL